MYKKLGIQKKILSLIDEHSRGKLWLKGVQQPSFLLAMWNHTAKIDPRWNTGTCNTCRSSLQRLLCHHIFEILLVCRKACSEYHALLCL